jgi:exodeoxyribonuclease VII small subunit
MAKKKFEEALEKLEKIVQRLEDANLPLDEALSLFEEGIKLSRFCSQKLEEAERKVEILLKDDSGNLSQEPFEEPENEK